MFGRINNLYQIIAHLGVAAKFAGYPTDIFGATDEQGPIDFQIMNALDYAGWIAIFSRLDHVPFLPKFLANTHMATGMHSLPPPSTTFHRLPQPSTAFHSLPILT